MLTPENDRLFTGSGAVDTAYNLWVSLANLGLEQVFFAPGSRCAPLVYGFDLVAMQLPQLQAHVRIDERSAAFNALGVGQATGVPAAVVTTSGTATAHLLAAVMEAHHSRVPLLVITADRPAELRGTGANQTTNQVGLYREFTSYAVDIPAPAASAASDMQMKLVADEALRAWQAANGKDSGPVHLNLCFRDPLTPDFKRVNDLNLEPVEIERKGNRPVSDVQPASQLEMAASTFAAATNLQPGTAEFKLAPKRTLVVAGNRADELVNLNWLEQNELPVIAEPSSGIRQYASANLVTRGVSLLKALLAQEMGTADAPKQNGETPGQNAQALTSNAHASDQSWETSAARQLPRPERVIAIGHLTLTRPVQQLLRQADIELVVVDKQAGTGKWRDPSRSADIVIDKLPTLSPAADQAEFLETWQQAEAAGLQAEISENAPQKSWQAEVALAVWENLAAGDNLLLASSSLIRDLDLFAGPAGSEDVRVFANRGLAGIDGTYATAMGIALADANSGRCSGGNIATCTEGDLSAVHESSSAAQTGNSQGRTRVLLGDLAAIHDLSSLVVGPLETKPDLDVIIVDDNGGRIFSGLEHSGAKPDLMQRFFTTPHGVDLAAAARGLNAQVKELKLKGNAAETSAEKQEIADWMQQEPNGIRVLVVRD